MTDPDSSLVADIPILGKKNHAGIARFKGKNLPEQGVFVSTSKLEQDGAEVVDAVELNRDPSFVRGGNTEDWRAWRVVRPGRARTEWQIDYFGI